MLYFSVSQLPGDGVWSKVTGPQLSVKVTRGVRSGRAAPHVSSTYSVRGGIWLMRQVHEVITMILNKKIAFFILLVLVYTVFKSFFSLALFLLNNTLAVVGFIPLVSAISSKE